ncbi:Alg9-like mannosyltransferase family-domain-containing protein [Scheffersomyces coipomensis]|uniref:Alg9-like mannosyltransferase family-domain-containing protein n=1 Tax=Scheffersomyces coipomensis TaxID=1788519 RepID=UPI00315CA459
MYGYNKLLDAALIGLISFYLIIAPFTKVEESFNLQAIHDILNYGIFPKQTIEDNYDHIVFPGAVPRTFVGSLVLAGIVKVINTVTSVFGYDLLQQSTQNDLQLVVRAVLGLLNAFSLIQIRESINSVTFRDRKSKIKGLLGFWYSVLLLSQFHILFYSTRTLPNFIALPIVNLAFSKLLKGDISGLTWLAFCGAVFRSEIGLFAVIIAMVSSLIFGQSNIVINVIMLASGAVIGGLLSFVVDSYFWGYLVVPELSAFQFNVILNKSAAWGVEPWSAYFTKYIWGLFRPPVILLLLLPGLVNDPADDGQIISKDSSDKEKETEKVIPHPAKNSLRVLFVSSILFIVALSFQGHKEWRFITYIIPIFTLQAANGLGNIAMKWSISWSSKLLVIIAVINVAVALVFSLFMGYFSSFNYPGADALLFVNQYIESNQKEQSNTLVHLDVAACMTGVSRFGELNSHYITYDKTETEVELEKIWNDIDILVSEDLIVGSNPKSFAFDHTNWELLHKSQIFRGITIYPLLYVIQKEKDDYFGFAQKIITGEESLLKLLNLLVITDDYLYVYKKAIEEGEVIEDKQEPAEVDVDEVIEEINEQIDSVVEEILSQED